MPYDCGVPFEDCTGGATFVKGVKVKGGTYKTHGDADGARRCFKRWVTRENEQRRADGRPQIIPKCKPQRLKRGKNLEGKGARWMGPAFRGA